MPRLSRKKLINWLEEQIEIIHSEMESANKDYDFQKCVVLQQQFEDYSFIRDTIEEGQFDKQK